MNDKNEKIDGDVKIKMPVSEKLENFWYHYKWHTVFALFAVVVITVFIAQSCSRTETDAYVLYAGPHIISRLSEDGNLSEYENATSSFKKICSDHTGDGVISVSFLDLFCVNSEESEKILAENPGTEINSALVKEDTNTLHQKLLFGEYYLCFLSERIFLEYEDKYEGAMFTNLRPYAEGMDVEFANDNGIYLESLPFYSLPEICEMPPDTVVCLRALSEVSETFGRADSEEHFKRGEDMLKRLLEH